MSIQRECLVFFLMVVVLVSVTTFYASGSFGSGEMISNSTAELSGEMISNSTAELSGETTNRTAELSGETTNRTLSYQEKLLIIRQVLLYLQLE